MTLALAPCPMGVKLNQIHQSQKQTSDYNDYQKKIGEDIH